VNEPKKRGRPSKAEIEARIALHSAEIKAAVEITALGSTYINPAQVYAERIWNGQSPSAMEQKERIQRVKEALQGQGLPLEGVELPGGFKL
jgi:hypothetical protein